MLPLEALPPGDSSGGVVYLRIVLSPEEASCMRMFLNINVLQGGVVSPSPNVSKNFLSGVITNYNFYMYFYCIGAFCWLLKT